MRPLGARLGDYDGRSTQVLEAIRDSQVPDARVLDEVIALADADVARVSEGATWLLRAWLERGAALSESQVAKLADRLDRVGSEWARLHIAQAVASINVPDEVAEPFAAFLRTSLSSERPFLRAWSMDGMVRLAHQHPAYADEADRAVRSALSDPAASVKARARRVASES